VRQTDNPFVVLGIPLTSTSIDVERAGKRLLAELSLGVAFASTMTRPDGSVAERTVDDVRQAMHTLKQPDARAVAEVLLALPPVPKAHVIEGVDLRWLRSFQPRLR
jgi:hypothetical protein